MNWLTRIFGFTETFWRQTRERVVVGAAIGASSAWLTGMSVWDINAWKTVAAGALVGAGGALAASLIGQRRGDPDSPLATTPTPSERRH
jgi:hypothetical protein